MSKTLLDKARESSVAVTNETPAQVTNNAQVIIDDLTEKMRIEREAYKAGRIGNKQFQKFNNRHQALLDRTIVERDKKLKYLRVAAMPADKASEAAVDARMKADHERRRYEQFMKAAGPALESALDLEESD